MQYYGQIKLKMLMDLLMLMLICIPILVMFIWCDPYKRGFFCDDESLNHPFHESTIKSYYLYSGGILFQTIVILVTEFVQVNQLNKNITTFGNKTAPWLPKAYQQIIFFAFGVAINQLITDVAKYSIGRLRPHFFYVCQPQMHDGTNCSDPINSGRYIENFKCVAIGSSERLLKEMRLSFPSGHTSFSAYLSVYCAIYLQVRMAWTGLLKHFIQFILLLLGWYTGMTRISDYKHHWSDVLAGAFVGVFCALLVSYFVSNLFEIKKRIKLPEPKNELKMLP